VSVGFAWVVVSFSSIVLVCIVCFVSVLCVVRVFVFSVLVIMPSRSGELVFVCRLLVLLISCCYVLLFFLYPHMFSVLSFSIVLFFLRKHCIASDYSLLDFTHTVRPHIRI